MALASPSSAETLQPNMEKTDAETPPVASVPPTTAAESSSTAPLENPTPNLPNPSPTTLYSNPTASLNQASPVIVPPAPPAAPSFTPSFRPFGAASIPQYTTVPNPSIQPPGVSAPSGNPMMQGTMSMYPPPPGLPQTSASLPYGSNGYMSVPVPAHHQFPPPVDHV